MVRNRKFGTLRLPEKRPCPFILRDSTAKKISDRLFENIDRNVTGVRIRLTVDRVVPRLA
jgi:hypothetical protein